MSVLGRAYADEAAEWADGKKSTLNYLQGADVSTILIEITDSLKAIAQAQVAIALALNPIDPNE